MDINKYGIKINFNQQNGQLNSIIYNGDEILYQGAGEWKKTFPICFPALGHTLGFKHKKIKYQMPKHGFWEYLDWTKEVDKNKILSEATIDHPNYPFKLAISQEIKLMPNKVITIKVTIRNMGDSKAFFHFGFHPAFIIEPTSFLHFGRDLEAFWINEKNALTDEPIILDENIKINKMGFDDPKKDTIFVEDFINGSVMLSNKKYALWIKVKSQHLQVWKNKNDDFICIEPWYGVQDSIYKYKDEVSEKKDIIEIDSKKSFTAKMKIKITENSN